jgi:uncharacterized membrane protein
LRKAADLGHSATQALIRVTCRFGARQEAANRQHGGMNTAISPLHAAQVADKWLKRSIAFWFWTAAAGLIFFIAYLLIFYGAAALSPDLVGMAKNKRLLKGFVPGDTSGNLMFMAHALLAAVLLGSGLIQLMGPIRQRWPMLHRWSGRVFLLTVFAASLSGLYLTWVRHTNSTLVGATAITLNAVLIFAFGTWAWRMARAREFQAHRAWALRAFIVACGVWFQRVGYTAWFIVMQGPVGITNRLDGPFDVFWGFACYLLPLALLELYLRAQASTSAQLKRTAAAAIAGFTLLMAVGIGGAAAFMWLPLIRVA